MATPFDQTPSWFNADFYLGAKLAKLQADDPKSNWTAEKMKAEFVKAGFANPYDHYVANGDTEGLNPNAQFDANYYIAHKVAQLGQTYTTDMVQQAIHDSGMTYAQHYAAYGFKEGISPSASFNNDKYLQAKLELLLSTDPKGEWTFDKVKESFIENGITPLTHYLTYGVKEGLNDPKYDYSEGGKPIPRPGNDVVLTTGDDIVSPTATDAAFRTSDRDDIIHSLVSNVTSKTTLNAGDQIDGGTGADVLKVEMQGSFLGFKGDGGVKNVETIELLKAGNKSFDATGVEAAKQYVIDGGTTGNVTIKNVDTTATQFVVSQESGSMNVTFANAAVAGDADAATFVLKGAGLKDSTWASVKAEAASAGKVEGINLIAAEKTDNRVTVEGNYDTVTVAGAGNVEMWSNSGTMKTFDASNATGKVTADIANASTTLRTINGGAGDDTISVSNLSSAAVLNGGGGKDTLRVFGGGNIAFSSTMSGFETLDIVDTSNTVPATGHTVQMANITDLNAFKLSASNQTATFNDSVQVIGARDRGAHSLEISNTIATGSTGSFQYDGNSTFTASLVGSNAMRGINPIGINTLLLDNVTQLDIRNDAQSGLLDINDVQAKNTTSLNINTGLNGVDIANSNGFAKLETVSVEGNGEATLNFGAGINALKEIKAVGLNNDLNVTLHGTNTNSGVTVYGTSMGDNIVTGSTSVERVTFDGGLNNTYVAGGGTGDVITFKGTGTNIVNGHANADNLTIGGDATFVIGGTGGRDADVVTFTGNGSHTVQGTAGVDTVTVNGFATINGGAGKDVLTLGSGSQTVDLTTYNTDTKPAADADYATLTGFTAGTDKLLTSLGSVSALKTVDKTENSNTGTDVVLSDKILVSSTTATVSAADAVKCDASAAVETFLLADIKTAEVGNYIYVMQLTGGGQAIYDVTFSGTAAAGSSDVSQINLLGIISDTVTLQAVDFA